MAKAALPRVKCGASQSRSDDLHGLIRQVNIRRIIGYGEMSEQLEVFEKSAFLTVEL